MKNDFINEVEHFKNNFIAVIERDGYYFMREVRAQGVIVSLLPYRVTADGQMQVLARIEVCPAHSQKPEACSITGGLEPDHSVAETACLELWEEAGYEANPSDLIALGTVRPSKAADTVVHLFAVNVSAKAQYEAPGDGSRFEQNSSVAWVDLKQAMTNKDPLFITAIARLQAWHMSKSSSKE